MRSFSEMLEALKGSRAHEHFIETRVGQPGSPGRKDAMIAGARLDDVIALVQAVEAGRQHRGWFIVSDYVGSWRGAKPGVDLDDHHPMFRTQDEAREWVDEYEDEREERERAAAEDIF